MSEIIEQSIQDFLDELASKSATPGGGSAAAIMGSVSAALTSMMCHLTLSKTNYVGVESDMQMLLQKSETLRVQFTEMIQADVEAFDGVMTAYGLSNQTEAEKIFRAQAIQEALKTATEVPLVCARLSAKAIDLSKEAAEKGNINVITDAGVAVMAAYAALKSVALNVHVNVAAIKDKAYTDLKLAELSQIEKIAELETEQTYNFIKSKL